MQAFVVRIKCALIMTPRTYTSVKECLSLGEPNQSHVDLAQRETICVRCPVCSCGDSRVVSSAYDLAGLQRFLQQFHRRRWRIQNDAIAQDRSAFMQHDTTDLLCCEGCSLLYRNPPPPKAAVADLYAQSRYEEACLRAEHRADRAEAARKILSVAQRLPYHCRRNRPRVLEMGCSAGGFLAEGLSLGWDMLGVEQDKDAAAFCREERLPVVHGTVQDAELDPASFDAVVMWNTFDQLPDPHPTLAAAARLLRNGGLLVLRVPNGHCFRVMMTIWSYLPVWLRRPLYMPLAWNNLLTFPYRYGYGLETVTNLTASYGFKRTACIPDTLRPAPADGLKSWAAAERHCCNLMYRAAWQALGVSGRFVVAPWLDLYFERACTDSPDYQQALDGGLGLLPVCSSTSLIHT